MPSKSRAQHNKMAMAAARPGGYDGIPASVGKDFITADRGMHFPRKARANHNISNSPLAHEPKRAKSDTERYGVPQPGQYTGSGDHPPRLPLESHHDHAARVAAGMSTRLAAGHGPRTGQY